MGVVHEEGVEMALQQGQEEVVQAESVQEVALEQYQLAVQVDQENYEGVELEEYLQAGQVVHENHEGVQLEQHQDGVQLVSQDWGEMEEASVTC